MSAFLFVVQIRSNPINLLLKLNFNSRLIIVLSSMAKNRINFIEKWCKTYPRLTLYNQKASILLLLQEC